MKFLSWIGTGASIAGSFIVAWQIFLLGYMLFLVGSVSWLMVAVSRRDKSLAILNGTFMVANCIGLWKVIQ